MDAVLEEDGLVVRVLEAPGRDLHDASGFHEPRGAVSAFALDWQATFGTTELP